MKIWDAIANRISFHAVYDENIVDALYFAADHGFGGVQIAVETPHLNFESISPDQCDEIRIVARECNLYVTLHAPDEVTSLFVSNRALKIGILAYYQDLFTFAQQIRAKIVTIHLGRIPAFPTATIPQERIPMIDIPQYQQSLMNNLETLVNLAKHHFTICIENVHWDLLIYNVVDPFLQRKQVALTWDFAKTHSLPVIQKNAEMTFFNSHQAEVRQIHLHDISSDGTAHHVVGSGIIDFRDYLAHINPSTLVDCCIEVRPREKALESRQNLARILNVS